MKTIAIGVLLAATAVSLSCGTAVCECPDVVTGVALRSPETVTAVVLSGSACQGGTFRCGGPSGAANAITTDCTHVQIDATTAGLCIIDVTAGSMTYHLERTMVVHNYGCCGSSIGDRYPQGEIDVRSGTDGGSDAASN
jgi:hypothetical protein